MSSLDAEIRRVWSVADRDSSGYVDGSELTSLMRALNGGRAPTGEEMARAMGTLDTDHDGRIAFEEFVNAMRAWLGNDSANVRTEVNSDAAVASGALAGTAALLDAGGDVDGVVEEGVGGGGVTASGSKVPFTRAGSLGSASRQAAHTAIASFFSNFTRETLDEAAYNSVREVVSKDASEHGVGGSGSSRISACGGGSWGLIDGPYGLFARMSPIPAVASGQWGDVTADMRVALLASAQDTFNDLPAIAAALGASNSVALWLDGVRRVRAMLSVCDVFNTATLRPAIRDTIINFYHTVAALRIPHLLLALLHPHAPAHAGVPVTVFDRETVRAIVASLPSPTLDAANNSSGVLPGVYSGASGSKRKAPWPPAAADSDDDGDASFLSPKRRAVAVARHNLTPPSTAAAIAYAASNKPNIPAVSEPCHPDLWYDLVSEVALTLAYMCLGPRLPHTPVDSFWHPANVWKGCKTLIIAGEGGLSGVPWILHHIISDSSAGSRLANAYLLAAIASSNKHCHYAVTVQQAGVYAVLQRISDPSESFSSVEQYFACLSVLCGVTLPPDCITVTALLDSMCGAALLNCIAAGLATAPPADASGCSSGSDEGVALRIRAHCAGACSYLLPLLDAHATWPTLAPILHALTTVATASFNALTASLLAAGTHTPSRAFMAATPSHHDGSGTGSGSGVGHLELGRGVSVTAAAAAVAAAAVSSDSSNPEEPSLSALQAYHASAVQAAFRCLRYMLVATAGVKVDVSLSSSGVEYSAATGALFAARAASEAGVSTSDLAQAATNALTSRATVTIPASVYLLEGTGALHLVATILSNTSSKLESLRTHALSFLTTAVKNAHEDALVVEHKRILPGIILALSGGEELQARAAALLFELVSSDLADAHIPMLFDNGLVSELARALAATRHPDDVLAENYSELRHSYNFGFQRDVVRALGWLFRRLSALCASGELSHAWSNRLTSEFNLQVIAALKVCVVSVCDDAKRTLCLHLVSVTPAAAAAAVATPDAFHLLLTSNPPGVDPARSEADESARTFIQLLRDMHASVVATSAFAGLSGPAVDDINKLAASLSATDAYLQQAAAQYIHHGKPIGSGPLGSTTGSGGGTGTGGDVLMSAYAGGAGVGFRAPNMLVPVEVEVAPGHGEPPQGPYRKLYIERGATWEALRSRVRQAYGYPVAELAYVAVPAGSSECACYPIRNDSSLEQAHKERELRGTPQLSLIAYDPACGAPSPVGTAAAHALMYGTSGVSTTVTGAGAMPGTAAFRAPAPGTGTSGFGGAGSGFTVQVPSYVEAISGLRSKYGDAILLDSAQMHKLYASFAAKMQAQTAAGMSAEAELNEGEFRAALASIGFTGDSAFIETLFGLIDRDGSGSISWEEMTVGLALFSKGGYETKMDFIFSVFDSDHNGSIDAAELTNIAEAACGLPRAECSEIARRLFELYDADGDGVLNSNEFKRAVGSDWRLASAFWSSAREDAGL